MQKSTDSRSLLLSRQNLHDRDVKDQRGVGRDVRGGPALPVSQLGRNGEPPLLSGPHPDHTLVPALDDLKANSTTCECICKV